MSDPTHNNHAAKRFPQSRDSLLFPTLCFLLAAIIAVDMCAIEVGKLDSLKIPYFPGLHFAPLIIPGCCALIWLRVRHSQPILGFIIPVLVCYTLILAIPGYVRMKTVSIPITHMPPGEFDPLQSRLGFRVVSGSFSGEGSVVIVAPAHEQRTRDELMRLGIIRESIAK